MKNTVVIGAGRWGKNLARNIYELGALHTICDPDEGLLDAHQKQYPDIQTTTNFQSVLENPLLTRFVISAPASLHYSLAKQALLAGKDVFVEKPLCLDLQEAEELIQLAAERRQILMVGHILQYHPCVRRLQELIGAGELGKLQYIVSNRLNLGAIRTEENALWDLAPHDISVVLSLCNQAIPETVKCLGGAFISPGIADTALTTMRFKGNLRAHIYVSWLNPYKEQKLVVVGSHGMLVFDDTKPWDEKLLLYRNHLTWTNGTIPNVSQIQAEKIEVAPAEPLKEECRHFLKCCDERIEPRTDGREGMRVLKVLQAAQASLNVDGMAKNPNDKHILKTTKTPRYTAHPTAMIDSNVAIGDGTAIMPFSHLKEGCRIGNECRIGQNVSLSSTVVLGDRVTVQNNVNADSALECEDDVFIGHGTVFGNVRNPRSSATADATILRKGATIGANATILNGIELGQYAFIEAGAVVTEDVKPFALISGQSGNQSGWVDKQGRPLDLPLESPHGKEIEAICPESNETYILSNHGVSLLSSKEQPACLS
jgi:UDP-2-acetamido-3-amino-2,3-dideoxy-glucuronate N-acetyltransferase